MKTFLQHIYNSGFKDGSQISGNIDFKTELVQLLEGIKGKGIGEKTKATIMQAYREREDKGNAS